MTRKLIALALCVMMLASFMVVPAYADASVYVDYVPGEKPTNLINSGTDSEPTMLQYFTQTNTAVAKVAWNSWTQIRVTSQVAYDGTTKVGKAGAYMPGALIHDTIMPDGTVTNDKYYVVNFYAKAAEGLDGTVRDTKVNIGVTNYRYESRLHTTKEYGDAGMDVSTDWKEFKGTIYVEPVHPTYASQRTAQVSLGLSAQALAGTGAIISDGLNGQPGKVYLAEEAAYDSTNERTSESEILTVENSATFKAQIVNQVGLPGYLDQGTFEWKAFAAGDTDRAAEISGFSFAANGNDVTVTVDNTVDPGEYVVVAYNAARGMAKGAAITVDTPSPYLDYTPGEKPENLIDSQTGSGASSTMLQYFTQTNTAVVNVSWDSWTHIKSTSQVAYDGTTKVGKAGYYMPGAMVHSAIMPADTIENEKSYVINYYAKAGAGLDGTVRDTYTNAGITNYRNEYKLLTTKEYGSQGMPVSSDWKEFKGTIYVEPIHASYATQRAGELSLGLSAEALAGTSVIISDGLNGEPGKVYFAEEVAYDITNTLTSDSDTISAGKSASFKANVVNQLGLPGYLDQTITWKVLDRATRKVELEGVTVEADGDTATVTTTKATAPGEYVVVAYNEANNMAKGVNLTITEPNYYEDYVAGEKPANLINSQTSTTSTMLQYFATPPTNAAFSNYGKISWNSWTRIIATSNIPYDGTTKAGMAEVYLVGAYIHDTIMDDNAVTNGKSYVVNFHARAHAGLDGTVRDTKANFAVRDFKNAANVFTKEYGTEGMDVSTDWKEYKGTFKLDAPTVSGRTAISTLGLSAEAPAGTAVAISDGLSGDPSKVYLAEEVAYDITNELVDGSATLADGASAKFAAAVVNQIGLPGYLDQTIEWRVMDKARENDIAGFIIEDDGTITVDGAVAGTYDVVAYNAANKMAKGFEITVTDAVEIATVTVNGGTLAAAEVENTTAANIMFVIASYNTANKKIVDVDKAVVAVVDGKATLAAPIVIDTATSDAVKVFVWDAATLRPIKIAE